MVAPFELLHFVLDHWQNSGFIDQQCDSAEFIEVMHQLSNAPASTAKLCVCFKSFSIKSTISCSERLGPCGQSLCYPMLQRRRKN